MSALQDRIRSNLKNSDGQSASQLADYLGADVSAVMRSLQSMPDAYIDRWFREPTKMRSREVAIWMVVTPPENCPRPRKSDAGV